MSNEHSTEPPGTLSPANANEELNHRLLALEQDLSEVISLYQFHQTAIQTMVIHGWPPPNERLNLGLTLTTDWLTQRGERVISNVETLKHWIHTNH